MSFWRFCIKMMPRGMSFRMSFCILRWYEIGLLLCHLGFQQQFVCLFVSCANAMLLPSQNHLIVKMYDEMYDKMNDKMYDKMSYKMHDKITFNTTRFKWEKACFEIHFVCYFDSARSMSICMSFCMSKCQENTKCMSFCISKWHTICMTKWHL